jgi:REase_AHJR-like
MNADVITRETELLDEIKEKYLKQGYEFIVHPDGQDLPPFLSGNKPDAIARRLNENVAIEIKLPDVTQSQKKLISFLSKEVPKHKGWRFELVLADKSKLGLDSALEPDKIGLVQQLAKVQVLANDNDLNLALILGWALLEAYARKLTLTAEGHEPKRYKPRSVIEALVSDGFVSDEQGQSLAVLSVARNRIVHGFSKTIVTPNDVNKLIEILQHLNNEVNT